MNILVTLAGNPQHEFESSKVWGKKVFAIIKSMFALCHRKVKKQCSHRFKSQPWSRAYILGQKVLLLVSTQVFTVPLEIIYYPSSKVLEHEFVLLQL